MPTGMPFYQEVFQRVFAVTHAAGLRKTVAKRLCLLVVGIIAAENCVLAKAGGKLQTLELTRACCSENVQRTLRRTLSDTRITIEVCYLPVLDQVIDWEEVLRGSKRVMLVVDESSKKDEVHLFRLSLAYWGGTLPLSWAIWEQNTAQPEGSYWPAVERVLAQVCSRLPAGLTVVVLADRLYDNPSFIDRVSAHGWHWIVRCKVNSSLRFEDRRGRVHILGDLIRRNVRAPGMRWKTRGRIFKDAGWRQASVVVVWGQGYKETLAVITDLPPRWEVLEGYGQRFWTEPGFRNDKKKGWQWEDSQVKGLEHQQRLLVAMAWASLIMLCLGVQEAQRQREQLAERAAKAKERGKKPAEPQPARHSLFTMGLHVAQRWLDRRTPCVIPWLLSEINSTSWERRWFAYQSQLHLSYVFQTVRP